MKLFRFLRKAENEAGRDLNKEYGKGGKSAGAALISELVEGEMYEFGEPWQMTSESLSAVVPILRKFDRDREYLVVQEIPKGKITITDSGRINKVYLSLKGVKKPVFVRAGTIFKGQGTQSRTNGTGVVLEPGKENLVDVFCVHASHRISDRSGFSALSHVVPRKVENALLSPSRSQTMIWGATAVRGFRARVTQCPACGSSRLFQNYEAELVCMQCGQVVAPTPRSDSDEERTRQIRVGVSLTHRYGDRGMLRLARGHARDNLVANLDEMTKFNQQVEKTLSKIPADLDNQVGVVIIDSRGVLGLEMFDHPDSWRAFSRSIVRNYAGVLAKERAGEGLFELKTEKIPQAIEKFLEKAQNLSETMVFKNKICETSMFSGEMIGEYTAMASNAIHLLLKRKTRAQA